MGPKDVKVGRSVSEAVWRITFHVSVQVLNNLERHSALLRNDLEMFMIHLFNRILLIYISNILFNKCTVIESTVTAMKPSNVKSKQCKVQFVLFLHVIPDRLMMMRSDLCVEHWLLSDSFFIFFCKPKSH